MNSQLEKVCLLVLLGLTSICTNPAMANPGTPDQKNGGWYLAYGHDDKGVSNAGAKKDLIAAIRAGKPVRVYWAGRRIEHLVDANFLSVLEGEVFAQISSIRGQRPSPEGQPPSIELAAPGQEWSAIISTNGQFPYLVKWFVKD